jgi:hypothetical protein
MNTTINVKTVKDAGRQEILISSTRIPFGAASTATHPNQVVLSAAGVHPVLQLPAGAVVLRGYLAVTDATTAGVTVAVGTVGSPTSIIAATAADAVATTAITPFVVPLTATTEYVATVVNTPVAVGEAYLVVEYFIQGKSEYTQG